MRTNFKSHVLSVFICLLLCCVASGSTPDKQVRIVLVGDVMLGRLVRLELEKNPSPKLDTRLLNLMGSADFVIGSFESSVGDKQDCGAGVPKDLCLLAAPAGVSFLKKFNFSAMSIENNHANDAGEQGIVRTGINMGKNGIQPLELEDSPRFFKVGPVIVSTVVFNAVTTDGSLPSELLFRIGRKIELAKKLSDFVIVYPHWGRELEDWPSEHIVDLARFSIEHGASIVVGSHPHVPIEPMMVDGRPVFYSVGNFIFDQKYRATKEGQIVVCDMDARERISKCKSVGIQTAKGSYYPELKNTGTNAFKAETQLNEPIRISNQQLCALSGQDGELTVTGTMNGKTRWKSRPAKVIATSTFSPESGSSEPLLLSLQMHYSKIDGRVAPRPYVYRIAPTGPVALWRGSALAWPLVDAEMLCREGDCILCALHRKESYIAMTDAPTGFMTAVYKWNGFGFSGIEPDESRDHECREFFKVYLSPAVFE